MQAIKCWRDLESFGIDALTGEACGYAMRLLCDVTASGQAIIESFFGGNVAIKPDSNWNRGSEDDPHVGSVLLPHSVLRELAAFCLLREAPSSSMVAHLREHGDDGQGFAARYDHEDIEHLRNLWQDADDAPFEQLFERWESLRVVRYYKRAAESVVARNQHAMSGRTE